MDPNKENNDTHSYFNYQVPDLMVTNSNIKIVQNDPDYLRDLGEAKTYRDDIYFSTEDFDEDYSDHFLTKGIKELVESINTQDEYRYKDSTTTSNLFQKYLTTMTTLKDLLLPKTDGTFHERWVEVAMDFQKNCEDIFLRFVKQEYILTFLPMVPKQLEYTSMKLKEMPLMNERDQENFKNLFSLIALGFIGKMKLLSFYLSLTSERSSKKEMESMASERDMMGADDQSVNYENTYRQPFNNGMETMGYGGQYTQEPIYEMEQSFEGLKSNFSMDESQSYRETRPQKSRDNNIVYNYKLLDSNGEQLYDIIEDDDDEEYTLKKKRSYNRRSSRKVRRKRKNN